MVIKKETPIATTTRAEEKTGNHRQGTNNLSIKTSSFHQFLSKSISHLISNKV
jgi:hypothetical protein